MQEQKPAFIPRSMYMRNPDQHNSVINIMRIYLDGDMPASTADDFYAQLENIDRTSNPALIILDITEGEPAWLAGVLDRFTGYGLSAVARPAWILSEESGKHLAAAQTDAVEHNAERWGF